jgi:hypothetical membrane protein
VRRERLIRCLATVLPQKIAEAPERVLINFACVLIGVSALITQRPGSLLTVWPDGFPETWALAMLSGGVLALVGYWNNPRRRWANSIERLGYLLILVASLIYGIGVLAVFGQQGLASGVIYLSIALAKSVRLLITSAFRTYLLRGGAPEETS